METLQERLIGLCKAAGTKHERVSRAAGLADGHVGLIASGHVKNPSAKVLTKIADVLGVSLDWLVNGRGEEPDPDAVRAAVERARPAPKTDAPRAA